MSEPKWLKDKDSWRLSDDFRITTRTHVPHPSVGSSINDWTIIGAWVDGAGFLKAYKAQCSCGYVAKYMHVSFKLKKTIKCSQCAFEAQALESTTYFKITYGKKIGDILTTLYRKRNDTRVFSDGPTFYDPWKADYKAFAEYIIKLPGFDQWPKLELDRTNNNRGYEPGNLRFVPHKVNMNNTKRNKTKI